MRLLPSITFVWGGNYWFVLPAISFGYHYTDCNVAIGFLKGEVRFDWLLRDCVRPDDYIEF